MAASHQELSLSNLSIGDSQLPLRPGYGVEGDVIYLRTNYFNMAIDTAKKLFRYTVVIKSERPERKQNQKPEEPKTYKTETQKVGDDKEREEKNPSRKRRQAYRVLFEDPVFQAIKPGYATDYGGMVSQGLFLQSVVTANDLC